MSENNKSRDININLPDELNLGKSDPHTNLKPATEPPFRPKPKIPVKKIILALVFLAVITLFGSKIFSPSSSNSTTQPIDNSLSSLPEHEPQSPPSTTVPVQNKDIPEKEGVPRFIYEEHKMELVDCLRKLIPKETAGFPGNQKWANRCIDIYEISLQGLAPSLSERNLQQEVTKRTIELLCEFTKMGINVSSCNHYFPSNICQ